MKYSHVYDRRFFDCLVKNNFITEDTGFKLQHCYQIPSECKFNREAAIGSHLHSLIKEGNNRTLAEGDHVDHAADATTTIRTKPGVELSILYTSSPATKLEKRTDGEYSLFLPATDLVIFNY